MLAGLALMLVGILFKVSAAPFHVWTPDVYEGAPSPVVALMSTAPKAAAFALLLRVVYEMFPTLHAVWSPLLWIVAVLSMTVGNLAALRQQNVKRCWPTRRSPTPATCWRPSPAWATAALPPPVFTSRPMRP